MFTDEDIVEKTMKVRGDSAKLAVEITRGSSTQTYFTFRYLTDREYRDDAFRAYAYFRRVDDILDRPNDGTFSEKKAFLDRQKALLEASYRGECLVELDAEEQMLVDLVRHDDGKNPYLHSYLFNMMAVMEFDLNRRHFFVSQEELNRYSLLLSTAVTDALHYFIGHDRPEPQHTARYDAVEAAHITHMLRDACEDVEVGYFNVPKEYLDKKGITPADITSQAYRQWVCCSVKRARKLFDSGRQYIAQVRNLRCRIAGYAYIARFEWILQVIEQENFCLRADYHQRKSVWVGLWMGVSALSSMLAFPGTKQGTAV